MVVSVNSGRNVAGGIFYTFFRVRGVKKEDSEARMKRLPVNRSKILKKLRAKLFGKFEKKIQIYGENNQAAKNVNDQIEKSKTIESKLSNLLKFKKQLKAFLKNQDDCSIVLNAIDSASFIHAVGVNRVHLNMSRIKKFQPLTSNRQDFIELQEEVMGITLEEIMEYKQHSVKIFLLKRVNSCRNGCSRLHPDVREATAILSNDKLRAFYDEEVKKKTLQPILSYRECEQLYDKLTMKKMNLVL